MKNTSFVICFAIAIIMIMCLNNNVNAYESGSSSNKLTVEEIALYSAHPTKAAKVSKYANMASDKTEEWYKNYCRWQGNGDAFRHAYWSALMTKNIDRDFACKVGLAHEGLKPGYDFDKQDDDHKMDISNNYSGRIIGTDNDDLSNGKLAEKVKSECSNGKLKRIRIYTKNKVEDEDRLYGVNTKYVGYYVKTTKGGLYEK